MSTKPFNHRALQVYLFLRRQLISDPTPPSLREIAEQIDIPLSGVRSALDRLQRCRTVSWLPKRNRTLHLLNPDLNEAELMRRLDTADRPVKADQIYTAIADFISLYGVSPNLTELSMIVSMSKENIYYYLKMLRKEGRLTWKMRQQRSFKLSPPLSEKPISP